MNILIIDCNREGAHLFAELLPAEGNEIRLALSEEVALAAIHVEPPQYVFVEVGRPELDGYALAKRLREDEDLSKAKFISISEFPQDRAREQSAGIDEHLRKPVQPQEIQAVFHSE